MNIDLTEKEVEILSNLLMGAADECYKTMGNCRYDLEPFYKDLKNLRLKILGSAH